jgi:hypothetical protein
MDDGAISHIAQQRSETEGGDEREQLDVAERSTAEWIER